MNSPDSAAQPTVLFVCNTNGGKSQMAAALLRQAAGAGVRVESAGLIPAHHINELAADVVLETGADMRAEVPSALTEERLRAADRVIIVGEARVPELEGVEMERWIPARAPEELATERERMEFLRDDLAARVASLNEELGQAGS
ncbi:low molecular weight phosphatase family protein [Paeniglutamicibacter sp. NPDC091659]|uniref:arsenate-mycothiol transferase ArsC n=1 Tax=Paeniglutamicibacter sp. NPDC091659 TaxID=3364389 RepID=UPI0038242F69